MSEQARHVPSDLRQGQVDVSDPNVSAWVAANAGSGKTHVLAQRVIRLLLDGAEPSGILCLTFTKAAAANMSSRVFGTLARWTSLDDDALDRAMREIGARGIDAGRRAHARRLFAQALETPGGLKVQTIHAFCTRLLHQFPFEANVAARFTVLDERAETELIDRLRLDVLLEAAAAPDGELGRALATAIAAVADETFGDVLRDAVIERDAVMTWVERAGSIAAARAELGAALGIAGDDTDARVAAEIVGGPILPSATWPAVAAWLAKGSANDQKQSARLAAAATATGEDCIAAYVSFFIGVSGEARKSLVTKALEAGNPALADRLYAERDRVCALIERRRAVAARDRTIALMTIARAVIVRYRAEKERRGLLDYDDLIDKTLALFRNVSAAWVLYKLDLGIDHVLIDEAQDTSPKQWEVIRLLVAEFAAGEGARGALKRTLFAVGDEKQSIFSFQGAAPRYFAEMRQYFERVHHQSELDFVYRDFKYSFRSAPVVLGAVDTVFGRPEAFAGLTADPVATVHQAVRENAPGLVEIWDMVEPDERREIEGWDAPFDATTETSPPVKLARRIAKRIAAWQETREPVSDLQTGEPRPMRSGDVLVLVRQRGALFEAIIRALKDAGIDVAGADRLMLTDHIAVMDLMVLADALLLEHDDLALATILRSPLFGLEEAHLYELAWQRPGTLRQALNAKAGADPIFAAAAQRLDRMASSARRESPFSFYARVLGPEGGRAAMLARLGAESADALDEFLSLALDYESRETPSLQGFIAWLRASTTAVKRDMETARDEVRVMTVHGAKGLEAPIVILADTTTRPTGPRDPRLLKLPAAGTPRLVWALAAKTDVAPVGDARVAARRAAEDEYRRLLYVAMTRAADRLIVCGAQGAKARPEGCWYDLVRDALCPGAVAQEMEGGWKLWRLHKAGEVEAAPVAAAPSVKPAEIVLPVWLAEDARREEAPAIVSPSTAIEEPQAELAQSGLTDERRHAMTRGLHVHRLLQSLPDIPPERREAAARAYLARAAADLDASARAALAAQVFAVLADPRFAPLAGPASHAEVPIVGRIRRDGRPALVVSGQVDRLAVTDDAVLIADYKTNRPAPRHADEVPKAYVTQLALYRAVLAALYPGKGVRAALVWTEVPDFMEISEGALDAALAAVTAP